MSLLATLLVQKYIPVVDAHYRGPLLEWDGPPSGIQYQTLYFCEDPNQAGVYGYRLTPTGPCGPFGPVIRVDPGHEYYLFLVNTVTSSNT